ncbi:hypothetical protein MDAP_001485 [Mitosporidium daphniae]|uniref:Uncharacterized protein n=1 Tax=Mitosporidium daphniae TaxID=1485682 RepID=A0A098VSP1_9MICR|nr:uncharacterized protein DI09_228p10 [Mitosporidium daphniae]KGG52007.1 hypothetical protein DI09_228p10 [Mitosporidium daphniae]|eukprot:XP_013238443.1 uncharacterized protein DI09_228p10 [Mitosporidium daphniae]
MFTLTKYFKSPLSTISWASSCLVKWKLCTVFGNPFSNLSSANRLYSSGKKKNAAPPLKAKGKKATTKTNKRKESNPLLKFPPGADLNSFATTRSNAESLHLSRSIDLTQLQNSKEDNEGLPYSIIREFSALCANDGIKISAFKQRNRYIRPCHRRRALMYANRKEKYNKLIGARVSELIKTYGHEIQIQ